MVDAITEGNSTHLPQHASDIVGPIAITGGSALCKYNIYLVIILNNTSYFLIVVFVKLL